MIISQCHKKQKIVAKDTKGNGKSCGTEVWICPGGASIKKSAGTKVCKNIAKLGYTNRGVKTSSNLYVLNHTLSPCILIECCFVDDKEDVTLYHKAKGNYKAIAKAIADAIG